MEPGDDLGDACQRVPITLRRITRTGLPLAGEASESTKIPGRYQQIGCGPSRDFGIQGGTEGSHLLDNRHGRRRKILTPRYSTHGLANPWTRRSHGERPPAVRYNANPQVENETPPYTLRATRGPVKTGCSRSLRGHCCIEPSRQASRAMFRTCGRPPRPGPSVGGREGQTLPEDDLYGARWPKAGQVGLLWPLAATSLPGTVALSIQSLARREIFLCDTCVRPQTTQFQECRRPVDSICGPLAGLGRRSCGADLAVWLNATVPFGVPFDGHFSRAIGEMSRKGTSGPWPFGRRREYVCEDPARRWG